MMSQTTMKNVTMMEVYFFCCKSKENFLNFQVLVGDCCLEYIKDQYCDECICHEDGTRHPVWPCNYNTGDGVCHDSQNVEVCEFDGGKLLSEFVFAIWYHGRYSLHLGDCCLTYIWSINVWWGTSTCEECICHEDGLRHPESPCPPYYEQSEGVCQDSWNIAECDYDGGEMTITRSAIILPLIIFCLRRLLFTFHRDLWM